MSSYYMGVLEQELDHFSNQITRVQVHLGDENGNKQGDNDKRCMIEVCLKGMEPTAVTAHAESLDAAVNAAIEKMKHALEHSIGKLRQHPVKVTDIEGV